MSGRPAADRRRLRTHAGAAPLLRSMLRSLAPALLWAAALTGQRPEPGHAVLGLLRDHAGKPVAAADIWFLPDPPLPIPALAAVDSEPPPVRGTSDARGAFRIAADRPGTLLVSTPQGLGALAAPVWPDRPLRLLLEPLAEVTLDAGSEPFQLWSKWLGAPAPRALPAATGTAVRLPAGRYEVWFRFADGFGWQQLELRSGQRSHLAWTRSARRLALAAAARVHPTGFPAVELLGPAQTECTLLGEAALAPLVTRWSTPAGLVREQQLPAAGPAAGIGPLPWPPAAAAAPTRLALRLLGAEHGAAGFVLRHDARSGFRVVAAVTAAPGGRLELAIADAAADCWLLATADGKAPCVRPLAALAADAELAFAPGRTIELTVEAPDGQPAAAVSVQFLPDAQGPPAALATSDALGCARLGPFAGDGWLRIDDVRYRNLERELPLATDHATLRLEPGMSVHGVVRRADGAPVAGVAVTLRDPQGRLRPAERTVACDAAGRFRFDGLEQALVVLFAQQRRAGDTWSAQRLLLPGPEPCVLELAHEDPQLRPPDSGR